MFSDREATREDIIYAGERALVCLYNGKDGDTLDYIRYTKFCQKVATSSKPVTAKSFISSKVPQLMCIPSDSAGDGTSS